MSKNKEVKAPQAPAEMEARMYIGPALVKRGLAQNAVFSGGELPPHVQELANANACVRALIVPVSQLVDAQAKLSDATSLEYKHYRAALKIN